MELGGPAFSPAPPATVMRTPLGSPLPFLVALLGSFDAGLAGAQQLESPASILPAAPSSSRLERVLVDEPGDGRVWALAEGYKASFGPEGFTFVPFFGSDAPENYPVRFALRGVAVGGTHLALDATPVVSREASTVVLRRGALDERYELGLDAVEQLFDLRCAQPGEVVLELELESALAPRATDAGLELANAWGRVLYGRAFVVEGDAKLPIATELDGTTLRLRVPAALRRGETLRIDPIIQAFPQFTLSQGALYADPDIAVLHPSGKYLLCFERSFSSRDSDIVSELHTAQGYVAGSFAAIEVTTAFHERPRVASVKAAERFLVVSQRLVGVGTLFSYSVWGRAMNGDTGQPATNLIQLSDLTPGSEDHSPDVGGDPGTGLGPHPWCVAWIHDNRSTDSDVLVRVFDQHLNAIALQPTVVADLPDGVFANVSVSSSNGNGLWAAPRWALVYELRTTSTNRDLHGATVDLNAQVVTPSGGLDSFPADTIAPCVSSPATDLAIPGGPHFLVTYTDNSAQEARARLLSATLRAAISPPNLTRSFGLGAAEVQCETDGCRFAITSRNGSSGSVATFGATTSGFALVESPQVLPGTLFGLRLCGARSGGGERADYGVVYQDRSTSALVRWALYEGRRAGTAFTRRLLGCGGLGIQEDGQPYLGARLEFELANVSGFGGGFLLGVPMPASPILCASCPLGVDPLGPLVSFFGSASFALRVPCDYGIVGATLGIQGFALSGGPCSGLRFSDAIDFTIR
jgi:hypothetical protein